MCVHSVKARGKGSVNQVYIKETIMHKEKKERNVTNEDKKIDKEKKTGRPQGAHFGWWCLLLLLLVFPLLAFSCPIPMSYFSYSYPFSSPSSPLRPMGGWETHE